MKRLRHYLPNYILSIILVFSIAGLSLMSLITNKIFSPTFYISSAEKHSIYQRVASYAEDYYTKSFAVSSIPAEIYMNGLDEEIVKQAVDGKINAFFDYIKGETDKIEETEIDFTQLEKNITDFFNEFAEEKNVEINDAFKQQLEKTLLAAENDIESFTNVYMLDYMEKAGIPQKLRKIQPVASVMIFVLGAIVLACVVIMIFINKKELKAILYWLATSGICASVIMLIPCIIIKSTNYFSRLVMRTDYIYYAVTGLLNDMVDSFMKFQLILLGASALVMVLYIVFLAISNKKNIHN